MPPRSKGRRPKGRRRSASDASDTSTGIEEDLTYAFAGGREDVLGLWEELDMEGKRAVLNVEPWELQRELSAAGLTEIELLAPSKLEEIVGNSELMTAIRQGIVGALHSEGGVMQIPAEPLLLCIVKICERHLLLEYSRRLVRMRLVWFAAFSLWGILDLWLHWSVRYGLLGALAWVVITSRPRIKRAREHVASLFDDEEEGSRAEYRLDTFLSALLCILFADWASWYRVVQVLVLVPLILLYLEGRLGASEQGGIRVLRIACAYLSHLLLVYFALYSWWVLSFVLFFFFPTLSAWVLSGTCMGVMFALRLAGAAQERVFPVYTKRHWALWLASLLALLWTWGSGWLLFLLNVAACLILAHPAVAEAISTGLGVVSVLMLEQGLPWVVTSAAKLLGVGAILIVGLAIAGWRKCRGYKASEEEASL